MDKLSSKVLSKIETEKITPIPRWQFLLKDSVTYGIFILNLIIGGVAVALTMHLFSNVDLQDLSLAGLSLWQKIMISIPVFWLILSAFFLFLAYYNFKHTPGGYRWNVVKIFVLNILVSIVLGVLLFYTGVSAKINQFCQEKIPFYTQISDPRYSYWMRPESGLLAGTITAVDLSNEKMTLVDLDGNSWQINISDSFVPGIVTLQAGEQIKLIGNATDNIFVASQIRPWNGKMMGVKGMHN